jgi:xylulokinase
MKRNLGGTDGLNDYDAMNELAASVPVGSEGLTVLPYGNGAERSLGNRDIGASIHGLDFKIHSRGHLMRAAQEGIVFALNYGLEIMHGMGIEVDMARAGETNMFQSPIFAEAFATATGTALELYDTDGSQGAARGAGFGAGIYKDIEEAYVGLRRIRVIEPSSRLKDAYDDAYARWRGILLTYMK